MARKPVRLPPLTDEYPITMSTAYFPAHFTIHDLDRFAVLPADHPWPNFRPPHPPQQKFAQRFMWAQIRYAQGLSDGQIAALEDMPESLMRAWREVYELPPHPDDPLTARCLPAYLAGLTAAGIATAAGIDLATLREWFIAVQLPGARGVPRVERWDGEEGEE